MSSVTKSSQGRSQQLKHLQEQIAQLEQQLAEAKQAEARSRQLLQSIIDASPDLIFVKDCDFRCLLANQSFAKALGTTPELIVGKNEQELGYSEEQIFGNQATNMRGFRADDLEVLAGKTTHIHEVATTVEGVKIFDMRKIPLYDEKGKVFAILGFARDMTERKQVEAERQKFVSLVENSSDLIGMADFAGNPFFINSAGLKMIGLDNLESLGKINIANLHPKSTTLMLKNVAFPQALQTGSWRGEGEIINQKTGLIINIEILVFLVCDSDTGTPLCMATVMYGYSAT